MKFLSFLLPLFLLTPTLAAQGDAESRSVVIDINFDGSPVDFKRIASEIRGRVKSGEIPRELAEGILKDIRERMENMQGKGGKEKAAKRSKPERDHKKMEAMRKKTSEKKTAKRGKPERDHKKMEAMRKKASGKKSAKRGKPERDHKKMEAMRKKASGKKTAKRGKTQGSRESMGRRGQRMHPGDIIIMGEARGRVKGDRSEHNHERMDHRGQRIRLDNGDGRRQEDGRRGPRRDPRHDDRSGPWNNRDRHEGVSLWG